MSKEAKIIAKDIFYSIVFDIDLWSWKNIRKLRLELNKKTFHVLSSSRLIFGLFIAIGPIIV